MNDVQSLSHSKWECKFWARGYYVSTVGTDEEVVRAYIKDQKKEYFRVEQLSLFM